MKRRPAGAAVFVIALAALAPYLAAPAVPTATSELARWYAEGHTPLSWQPRWGGGSPTWTLGPPGLPALAALASKTGLPPERAVPWAAALLYALGAVGIYQLGRAWKWPAFWMGLAFALAPFRWVDLVRDGNAAHAVALALLPSAGALIVRHGASAIAAAMVALVVLWPPAPAGTGLRPEAAAMIVRGSAGRFAGALLLIALFWFPAPASGGVRPELELLLVLGAGWLAVRQRRSVPVIVCAAVFAAGLAWEAFATRPARGGSARWDCEGTVLGAPAPAVATRRQPERLILEPGHPAYTVLWLQALGVGHVVSADRAKFDAILEPERDHLYYAPVRHTGSAVLVSRYQFSNLAPLRSFYDRPGLAAYVEWANRPEGAGFRWVSGREAEVRADLGPDDMVLVRQNAAGWTASVEGQPVATHADPIGYLVLDPRRTGPVTIRLHTPWRAGPDFVLPEHAVPVLTSGGIVDAERHTPPPFAPGTVVTLYGSGLGETGVTRVLAGGRSAEVSYANEGQVNARLPGDLPAGAVEVVVEVNGVRSNGLTVEIDR
jgi:hypothetical protein